MGSGKWAVEGLQDTRKHLNPDGGRQAGEKGQIANGAETGIRWKTGEEPKLGVLLLGAQKIVGDGEGREEQGQTTREGGAAWGRKEAPVWPLPASERDGLLRCDWEEEATSRRGGKELSALGAAQRRPRVGSRGASARASAGQASRRGEQERRGWGALECTVG